MKRLVAFFLLGMCCFFLTTQAWAEEVTRQLPFSKKVKLVVPKRYLFMFELCADNACADVTYAETQTIVLKTTTLSFNLGAGAVDPNLFPAFSEVDFSQQYWLRISRSSAKGFVAIGPPSKLSVVPYALWSNQVEGVGAGVGTITGVYGGDGLNGSASSGAVTLNVGAGSGIAVGADTVSIASGGVTSAHIQDGAVASADVGFNYAASSSKGGPATTAVDSDSVDGRHAMSMRPVLATSATGTITAIQSSCTNYRGGSVTITVPTSGVVVVEFDVWILAEHINGIRDYGFAMVGTSASDCTGAYANRGIFEVPASYGNNFSNISIHVTRPISVAAGTYTYYLNGYILSGAPDDYFYYANMKAVFYPD